MYYSFIWFFNILVTWIPYTGLSFISTASLLSTVPSITDLTACQTECANNLDCGGCLIIGGCYLLNYNIYIRYGGTADISVKAINGVQVATVSNVG